MPASAAQGEEMELAMVARQVLDDMSVRLLWW